MFFSKFQDIILPKFFNCFQNFLEGITFKQKSILTYNNNEIIIRYILEKLILKGVE